MRGGIYNINNQKTILKINVATHETHTHSPIDMAAIESQCNSCAHRLENYNFKNETNIIR